MKVKRGHISLADLLSIQVLRRLDENEPKYCADIDAPLAADAKCDHRGHLKDPVRVLSERADLVLQTRHGVNAGWLGELVGWLRVMRFFGYVVVLVIAFGLAEPWLREGEVVNVEWLFGFLGTLVVSMTITTVLMVMAIFARRKSEDSPDQESTGGATNAFAKLLVVHWLIQFVVRRAVPWIERRILKRSEEKSPEEIKRIENVSNTLYETLSQQSRRMALEAASTSNTVWFLLSLGVLLSLGKMGLFREYDFRWQATIVSEDFMRDTTQTMAKPIKGWPLVDQPTDADVHWLATGELSETALPDEIEQNQQYHRQLWGRLFLAYLLYYGVLPRFVLMIVSRWLAARGWKSLKPRLKDDYFKTIVANIEKPPFDSSQEEQEDPEDQTPEYRPWRAETESEHGGVSPSVTSRGLATEKLTAEDPSSASDEQPVGTDTVVFSYDVPEPEEGWPKTLAMARNGNVISLGNASDRASRKRASTEIIEQRNGIGLLVVVANLVDNPDGLFEHFVRENVDQISSSAGRSLILVGGERLRKRYEGDAQKVGLRIDLWKQRGIAAGIDKDKIVEFDHEHATAAGQSILREKMKAIQPQAKPAENSRAESGGLQSAGLFRKATSVVIMSRIHESTAQQSSDELRKTTMEIHEGLRNLYRKQASALEKAFANVNIDTNRIRAAVSEKTNLANDQFDKLEDFSRMSAVVQRYTKGLSGKWAIGGGVVCALGSGTLAALSAPALLPALLPAVAFGAQAGVVGSLFSAHTPHLVAKLTRRRPKPDAEADDPDEDSLPTDPFCLDDLVRSSTLLALILELQGNSEDRIAHALEAILSELPDTELTTPEAASAWLTLGADNTENFLSENPAD